MLTTDGNPNRDLTSQDFDKEGKVDNKSGELALVVGSAEISEQFIANKQWNLLWRDADLLYQSPRPMSVYENTYVLEPNVQRFTVAKVCNAIIPQLLKGLFFSDPPMILRPRPGTSQDVIEAKSAIFSYLLDKSKFKRETKWGLEQMGLFGTGIWKWGISRVEEERERRISSAVAFNKDDPDKKEIVSLDVEPEIKVEKSIVNRPFFEWRPLTQVLVDPHLRVGDIREADYAIDLRYMDYYQVKALLDNNKIDGKLIEGWQDIPNLMDVWLPPTGENAPVSSADKMSHAWGLIHHAEDIQLKVSPNPLFKKLEVLEYWDKKRKILVLQRKKVMYSGDNPFKQIPFFSANWWNRPKAFYGMGLGLIVGQNQRVDQGTINAILKIISFGVNPIYLRSSSANGPTQMIRTGLGRILTVDGQLDNSYRLLETPEVKGEVWSALQESSNATESSSGADQLLVQGTTSGPRSSMGRTAGGAGILAGASATRLDGPLDNFLDQVFTPFLYVLDYMVFHYMTDAEIMDIVGDELGHDLTLDMQTFHDADVTFEVLAGSSLAAKRVMAQSMPLITQIFENPAIQSNLAEINGEYIDFKQILSMWLEASEWKNFNDIIKPLTPEMKQRMAQQSAAAQQQSKLNQSLAVNEQKFNQKRALNNESSDNRLKEDITRAAFKATELNLAKTGEPGEEGLQGMLGQ